MWNIMAIIGKLLWYMLHGLVVLIVTLGEIAKMGGKTEKQG